MTTTATQQIEISPQAQVIDLGFRPRPLQLEVASRLGRFNVLVCHRGWGKTIFTVNQIINSALNEPKHNPIYIYATTSYGHAKRVAWDPLKEYTAKLPIIDKNEQDLTIRIRRPQFDDVAKIILLGADNPGSNRGVHPHGIVIDEYAECDPSIWTQVFRPALSTHKAWAIFIGTPKGMNHFYKVHMHASTHGYQQGGSWYTAIYKASETGIFTQEELLDARADMAEEEYAQEYECSFQAALIGAYYGKEMAFLEQERRMLPSLPYDPTVPVTTSWDLGMDDSTSIWFIQEVNRERRIIDYIEDSGRGLDYYADLLKGRGYSYDEHLLPHDAAARELGTGKSRQEILHQHLRGLGRIKIVPRHKPEDGIQASRTVLKNSYFATDKCARGIDCLKQYSRKWDAKNGIFSSEPKHDWTSHGADAFRCYAMGRIESYRKRSIHDLPPTADNEYDVFNPNRGLIVDPYGRAF